MKSLVYSLHLTRCRLINGYHSRIFIYWCSLAALITLFYSVSVFFIYITNTAYNHEYTLEGDKTNLNTTEMLETELRTLKFNNDILSDHYNILINDSTSSLTYSKNLINPFSPKSPDHVEVDDHQYREILTQNSIDRERKDIANKFQSSNRILGHKNKSSNLFRYDKKILIFNKKTEVPEMNIVTNKFKKETMMFYDNYNNNNNVKKGDEDKQNVREKWEKVFLSSTSSTVSKTTSTNQILLNEIDMPYYRNDGESNVSYEIESGPGGETPIPPSTSSRDVEPKEIPNEDDVEELIKQIITQNDHDEGKEHLIPVNFDVFDRYRVKDLLKHVHDVHDGKAKRDIILQYYSLMVKRAEMFVRIVDVFDSITKLNIKSAVRQKSPIYRFSPPYEMEMFFSRNVASSNFSYRSKNNVSVPLWPWDDKISGDHDRIIEQMSIKPEMFKTYRGGGTLLSNRRFSKCAANLYNNSGGRNQFASPRRRSRRRLQINHYNQQRNAPKFKMTKDDEEFDDAATTTTRNYDNYKYFTSDFTKIIYVATGLAAWNLPGGYGCKPFQLSGCNFDNCYLTDQFDPAKIPVREAHLVLYRNSYPSPSDIAKKHAGQIWVFHSLESPVHIGTSGMDYLNNIFNWTATYRTDSELVTPYAKLRLTPFYDYGNPDMSSLKYSRKSKSTLEVETDRIYLTVINSFSKILKESWTLIKRSKNQLIDTYDIVKNFSNKHYPERTLYYKSAFKQSVLHRFHKNITKPESKSMRNKLPSLFNTLENNNFEIPASIDNYIKWVLRIAGIQYDEIMAIIHDTKQNMARGKSKPVAWFVSNCFSEPRKSYVKHLQTFIDVDIFGPCGRLSCSRSEQTRCFQILNDNYKFYLSFENSRCKDYVTEKFFENAIINNVIPIVLGPRRSDYQKLAPSSISFIHIEDFESPAHLALYLHIVDSNDVLYNAHISWKIRYRHYKLMDTKFWCRVCAMINLNHYERQTGLKSRLLTVKTKNGTNKTWKFVSTNQIWQPRIYKNFTEWWGGNGVCY